MNREEEEKITSNNLFQQRDQRQEENLAEKLHHQLIAILRLFMNQLHLFCLQILGDIKEKKNQTSK